MAFTVRELFARLIQCEAGGEGLEGMRAVASVVMNRVYVPYGEFSRVSKGGDVRAIITQPYQFSCLKTQNNTQNIYNITTAQISSLQRLVLSTTGLGSIASMLRQRSTKKHRNYSILINQLFNISGGFQWIIMKLTLLTA